MQGGTGQRVRAQTGCSQDLVEASKEDLLRILQVKGDLLQGCSGIMVEVSQRLSAGCHGGYGADENG